MTKINSVKKTLLIILLFNIAFSTHLFSQNKYKRKISISEWIAEMEACKDEMYWLENTEIFYDHSQDSLYAFWHSRSTKPTAKDNKNRKTILPPVIIRNCKLPANATCQVRNVIFQNNIAFSHCEGANQFIFYNCTFKQGLDLHQSDLGALEFQHCSILQRIVVRELQISLLAYNRCSFRTDYKRVKTMQRYGFETENKNYQYLFNIGQSAKMINTFYLKDCEILPTEVIPVLTFIGSKYNVIHFQNIDFDNSIINLSNCSVKEGFTVTHCSFKRPFGTYKFNFPKDNTFFNWNQIDSLGLGLYKEYSQTPYTHNTDSLVSNVDLFNSMNSSYQKFFSMYRTQGDTKSANACYIQMKNMETNRLRHLYQQNSGVNEWFDWRFNQFLKYFSEYGTNPVQSLIVSMWTILFFAMIYFFFHSDWDGINRKFLIKQHRKTMLYFRSEQKLEDFYMESYMEDLKAFADYKKEMTESKIKVPTFILLLGKPLYLLSVIKHKASTLLYRKTEVLQGRWVNLKPARKISVALTFVLSLLVYVIYLIFVRALNSTTLSINAFSTLGFGAIPVKGASRYITILEGFLGWFLLSIFSASLISQMLQS